MSDYKKPLQKRNYGSIPHLLGSKLGATDKYVNSGQHKIMTEKTRDKNDYIIVTEKYDGSNVGITKVNGKIIAINRAGYLAETSPYKQHYYFAEWVRMQGNRFDFIREGERISGEWMLQVHGIKYDILSEPFIAFDIFNHGNERIPYADFLNKAAIANIQTPRIIFQGYQSFPVDLALEELYHNKEKNTIIAQEKPEGLVYRVERKNKFDYAAKFVRADFECGKYINNISEDDFLWNVSPDTLIKL
jgi:hypothetical protein